MAESFLQQLDKSGLLTADQWARVAEWRAAHAEQNDRELARSLIAEGLLTRFQANRLLAGHSRGFSVGRYRLLDVLGSGGMGVVYLAEEATRGDRVALKVLSEAHKNDPGLRARFELEARAGLLLNHPRIVRTIERSVVEDVYGQLHVLAMEYWEGINLQELLEDRKTIPWPQACDFAMQAAEGLEHAHRQGVVHRDVKPTNLLVGRDGTLKILDFGLALIQRGAEADEFSLSMIFGQQCLGTDDYLSPEQALDSGRVDGRADIYSLGCSLYEMISGCLPFPFDSPRARLMARLQGDPKPLSEWAPQVPPEVAGIVARMMARRPDQRFASAAEVAEALSPWAERNAVPFHAGRLLTLRSSEARARADEQNRKRRADRGEETPETPRDSVASSAISEAERATAVRRDTRPQEPAPLSRDSAFRAPATKVERDRTRIPATEPAISDGAPASARYRLIPEGKGPVVALTDRPLIIGRSSRCDVSLASARISAGHCELRPEAGYWRIRDLNSTNGIRINGQPVSDQLLWPGDRLTLADEFHFRVELADGSPPRRGHRGWWIAGFAVNLFIVAALVWLWLRS